MADDKTVETQLAADGGDDPALHDANVQQALDNADGVKDHQRGAYPFFEMRVLAAEVRRLRDEVTAERGVRPAYEQALAQDLAAEVLRLREDRDLFRTASEAAELKIVELKANHASLLQHHDMWKQQWEVMRDTMWKPAMAKLARVEALQLKENQHSFTGGDGRDHLCIWPEDLDDALRDEVTP